MNTLFRSLNAILLAGILCVLVLIFLQIRKPIAVKSPVEVQGAKGSLGLDVESLSVTIDNQPLEVRIMPRE